MLLRINYAFRDFTKIFHYNINMIKLKIRELREKIGISQKELAQKLGITPTSLYRYEYGINEPNIALLIKMADIFGVSVDEIVGATTPMLDLRKLDKTQTDLIKEILQLNPRKAEHILGYIRGINDSD